jgi:hypothetical protein
MITKQGVSVIIMANWSLLGWKGLPTPICCVAGGDKVWR